MSMSANAHKPIIAILILLVASFSSAHAAPHSGASAINLAAPPPPSPNSYPAALYTVGSQRKLLLIRQLFTPEHVLYTPFPLAPTRSLARSLSTVVWQVRGRPSGSRLDHGQTGRNQITSCLPTARPEPVFPSRFEMLVKDVPQLQQARGVASGVAAVLSEDSRHADWDHAGEVAIAAVLQMRRGIGDSTGWWSLRNRSRSPRATRGCLSHLFGL